MRALVRRAAPARRWRRVHQGCGVLSHRVGLAHMMRAAARVRAAEDKTTHPGLAQQRRRACEMLARGC